jgi:UDP-N-acetylglucosamine 2-epimerase (non-hydrolysing)
MPQEEQLGSLPEQDHDHDVLLIAGSRPEVARLAPVATAFADANRITALTVATGTDPMGVHEAFEALGVPADVTLLPRERPPVHPAGVGAMLMTRLDELLVDLDPSAVMVHGGGMTAAMAAQVAFWRQIPVVHLQAGVASDDLLCPFPQEANRRVIGQLASLFLTTGGAALGSPIGPNAIPVGDTMAANPAPADLRYARLVRRVRAGSSRLVLVGLDRGDSLGVLAGLPDLLEREHEAQSAAQISAAEFLRLPKGSPQSAVEASVGEPDGRHRVSIERLELDCWYYGIAGATGAYQLCFVDGKLRSKVGFGAERSA